MLKKAVSLVTFSFLGLLYLPVSDGLKCYECMTVNGMNGMCPCDTDPDDPSCKGRSRVTSVDSKSVVDNLWSPAVIDALWKSSTSKMKAKTEACAIIVFKDMRDGTMEGLGRNLTEKIGSENYFPDDANCNSLRKAPPDIYAKGTSSTLFRLVESCVCFTDFCNRLAPKYDSRGYSVFPSLSFLICSYAILFI